MRRHSWKNTESQIGFDVVERCTHCHTERVSDKSTKTLFLYRGGKALVNNKAMPQDGRWQGFIAGVVPQCVER